MVYMLCKTHRITKDGERKREIEKRNELSLFHSHSYKQKHTHTYEKYTHHQN